MQTQQHPSRKRAASVSSCQLRPKRPRRGSYRYEVIPDEAPVVIHSSVIQQERTTAAKKLDHYSRLHILDLHNVSGATKLKPAESLNRLVNSSIDIPLKTAVGLEIMRLEDIKRKANQSTPPPPPPVQDTTPPVSPSTTIQPISAPSSPLPQSIMMSSENDDENLTLLSDVSSDQHLVPSVNQGLISLDDALISTNQNLADLDNTLTDLLSYCKTQKEEIEGLNKIIDQLQYKNITTSYMLDCKNDEVKKLSYSNNELVKQVDHLKKEKTQLKSIIQSMNQTFTHQLLIMQQQQQQQRLAPGTYRWVVYQQPQPQQQ